ncbi:hypothetical protein [Pseudomonas viridiflava]|uniref:hypothetical protein n=1 Tax=Pseudomonas viridiflava TaxID=33069 RepID=UPI000F02312E|nr:hypothetical protein [Pseudomonas viridiflava]
MASQKISAQKQRDIEIVLTKWTGRLTWDALVTCVEVELGLKTTRQTLCTYLGIKACYKNRKSFLRMGGPNNRTDAVSDIKLLDQVTNLRAEIAVLKKNNAEQLRLIERIFANASFIPNLDLRVLIKLRPEEIQKS